MDQSRLMANSANAFSGLIKQQQPDGTFIPPDATTNPETRWYDELILLHAVAGYAARTGNVAADQAAARSASYHLMETQPDHASAQPWGLLAFIRHAPAMADQMLHAVTMQYPGEIQGVPLLLLTDALYGLRHFQRKTPL